MKFDDFKITQTQFDGRQMTIDEIEIDDDKVIEEIAASFEVELVFPETELKSWAESNGYIKEEEEKQ